MRRLHAISAIVAIGVVTSNAYLWRQLGEERARSRQAVEARRRELGDVAQRLLSARASIAQVARSDCAPSACRTRGAAEEPQRAAVGAAAGASAPLSEAVSEYAPTPREERILALRSHGELLREMELSDAETGAIVDVLVAHQRALDVLLRRLGGAHGLRNGALASARPQIEQLEHDKMTAVVARLGERRAQRLHELEQTLPARLELKDIRDHLEAVGAPMNEEQKSRMLALLSGQEPPPSPQNMDTGTWADGYEEFRAWRSERDENVQQLAASWLTPEQQRHLEQYQSWQASNDASHTGQAHE